MLHVMADAKGWSLEQAAHVTTANAQVFVFAARVLSSALVCIATLAAYFGRMVLATRSVLLLMRFLLLIQSSLCTSVVFRVYTLTPRFALDCGFGAESACSAFTAAGFLARAMGQLQREDSRGSSRD